MAKEEIKREVNWFVRIALILLAGLIFTMVIFKFFYTEPISDISAGLIILIAFLLILVLSESFDNFSLGKIISLSRELKSTEQKVEKIETQKKELLNQILSLSNNNLQRQSNTSIYGLPSDISQYLGVQKVSEDEKDNIEEKFKEEFEEIRTTASTRKRLDFRKVKQYILDRYIATYKIDVANVFKEVRLKEFERIDPISEISPIYDGYIKELEKEVFIEIRLTSSNSIMLIDRLYIMLSKVHHYRQIKKSNAVLTLILVDVPSNDRDTSRFINRIHENFSPALINGLLKIIIMEISEKDIEQFYRE